MAASVHAFGDDALAAHDAVTLAELVRTKQISAQEVAAAALTRLRAIDPTLRAVAREPFERPRIGTDPDAPLYGVPTFVKDNTDLRGAPTGHGSAAFTPRPARRDGRYAEQFLGTGMTVLGKSRLPEFGFNASTEFQAEQPTVNPWDPSYSVGASSGGSAALVASGVVPIAHANDGGGSIRIPAACAGLVGLKPTRHRHLDGEQARQMPINLISEGVLTRTVRDTAAFLAAAEKHWRNPNLPPIGMVNGPADRTLRIGLLLHTVDNAPIDAPTRAATEHTAALLEQAGHLVEPIDMPIGTQFADDFLQYWMLLADLACTGGRFAFGRSFDSGSTDPLTRGLRAQHRRTLARTPGALRRLRHAARDYARMFDRYELVVSPVLAHTTPKLGYLSPGVPYDELIVRLRSYLAYTPLHNVAGTPGMSLPMGVTETGLPIGVHLSAAHGDERTLLEVAYSLEALQPFPVIRHPANATAKIGTAQSRSEAVTVPAGSIPAAHREQGA